MTRKWNDVMFELWLHSRIERVYECRTFGRHVVKEVWLRDPKAAKLYEEMNEKAIELGRYCQTLTTSKRHKKMKTK